MVIQNERVLSAIVTRDDGGGEGFLIDAVSMLEAIAARVGATMDMVDQRSTHCVLRLTADASQLAEIAHEIGVHRAQIVPGASTTGRVMTSHVTMSFALDPGPLEGEIIVKTYNYGTRKVTRHSTGRVSDLGDVLAGLP